MAVLTNLFLPLLCLCSLVSALPAQAFQRRDTPALPSVDPWYNAPDGFESAKPGEILKKREVPNPIAAFRLLPINLEGSKHVMYRSEDNFGKPAVAVTTILVPHDADYTKLLSYQVAEDAASPNCGPSYALQKEHATGPDDGTMLTQAELLLMIAALENKWVVTAPDFEGPDGAFLANNRAGHAVLDGIRATLNSTDFTGVSPDAVVTMWGYSGGSLASGFAAELQPSYAPELAIAGAAIGGTVPQIYPVIDNGNESGNTGLIPSGILGLSHEYPSVKKLIDEQLVPAKRDEFMAVADQCFSADADQFSGVDIYTFVKDPDIFKDPKMQEVMKENSMGHHVPKIPMYVYKADKDEISNVTDTNELVTGYCKNGTIVNYHHDETADHPTLAITGAPGALIWLKDRMVGEPVSETCTSDSDLASLLDPEAFGVLTQALIDALLAMLNAPVRRV